MTSPSDDEGTPLPHRQSILGLNQNELSHLRQLAIYGVFVSGVILTIGMLILIWIAVHPLNRTVEASKLSIAGHNERLAAKADHDAIIAVARSCSKLTGTAQAINVDGYLLTMAADDDAATTERMDGSIAASNQRPDSPIPGPSMSLQTPSYALAAIVLSHHIGWARIALAEQERWTSSSMQIFQWLMVVIGAITTVLVSIKAISNEQWGLMSALVFWR